MKRLAGLGLTLGIALTPGVAQAQAAWPERPITFVVPYAPGATGDIGARLYGEELGKTLGQTIVLDNKPGGGGIIATETTAKAPPDGYTILMSNTSHSVLPSLHAKLPYDPIKDFAPVTLLATTPNLLVVNNDVPAKTLAEFIALGKKEGKMTFASAGSGTSIHVSGELFKTMTGIDMTHIPYKSAAPALSDVIGGQIEVLFNNTIATVPFITSGRLRALAVTSQKRVQALPELPTIDEAGLKGYDNSSWSAIGAPAGTPREIIAKLNSELNQILKLPDIREKSIAGGADIIGGTPEQFAEYLKSEIVKLARVVKEAKITAE